MLRLLFSLCLIIPFLSHAQLEVSAVVSQNPVGVGQSFTLEVSANKSLDSYEFDPQVLLKQGFVVGGTSTSRRHQIINGDSSTLTSWTTTLMVRKTGNFLIPSFNVGGAQTVPIKISAKDLGYDEIIEDQVRLEVSLSQAKAYTQQAIRYTAKVWVSQALDQANFIDPAVLDASVVRLGDDQQDIEIVDGQRYRTLTRQWLITPKKAGDLKIMGPRLSGLASDNHRRSRPVDITGQTLWLDVKNPPNDFPGTWLPTEDLLLTDELQPQQSTYQQGQAFTRQIVLTVAGITEQQLPEIDIEYSDNFRVYPEAYQDRTIVQDGIVFAQRILNVALIPAKDGSLNLPGWKIPWWDINQDRLKTASIAAKNIQVVAQAAPMNIAPTSSTLTTEPCEEKGASTLSWLLCGLFALLSALMSFLWWRERSADNKKRIKPQNTITPTERNKTWQDFAQACKQQNPLEAERCLAQWQREQNTQRCSEYVDLLAAHNWDKKKPAIDLAGLYAACQEARKEKGPALSSPLPPLN